MPRRRNKAIDATSTLPSRLPAAFEPGIGWGLDGRYAPAREIAADLTRLWSDLGGLDRLSLQRRMLVLRVVYLHRRLHDHETRTLRGEAGKMDDGQYAQAVNTLNGLLRSLGLDRVATDVFGGVERYLNERREAVTDAS